MDNTRIIISVLLTIIGVIIALIFIILLIKSLLTKNRVRMRLIGLGVGLLFFVIGRVLFPAQETASFGHAQSLMASGNYQEAIPIILRWEISRIQSIMLLSAKMNWIMQKQSI